MSQNGDRVGVAAGVSMGLRNMLGSTGTVVASAERRRRKPLRMNWQSQPMWNGDFGRAAADSESQQAWGKH